MPNVFPTLRIEFQHFLIVTFKKFGIGTNWVTETSPEAFAKAIDEKTKAIFVETIGNPKYVMFDLPALAKVWCLLFHPPIE
jgi:O-acetylhomoserine/O-acetylserine sulfhydrylase-like pyridoxal-dependent enzyme